MALLIPVIVWSLVVLARERQAKVRVASTE